MDISATVVTFLGFAKIRTVPFQSWYGQKAKEKEQYWKETNINKICRYIQTTVIPRVAKTAIAQIRLDRTTVNAISDLSWEYIYPNNTGEYCQRM